MENTVQATPAASGDLVEASVNYVVDTGAPPVTHIPRPGADVATRDGRFEAHVVAIQSGRPKADTFGIEREGFVFARHHSAVSDFYDDAEVRSVYYPETAALVKAATGAAHVMVFDHTIRASTEATRTAKSVREPVRIAHNDYTDRSAPQRVRDLLPAAEAEARLSGRFAVVQVWRPIGAPVQRDPLAICDARSIADGDLKVTELRYEDRVGEVLQLAFNPQHSWYNFPEMTRDEALVFKCFDSLTDGRARFTAHSAFDDPNTPMNAPERESIEMRTFAFY
ncbi:MAG TPA: CmcJ/NvfI family oxidoreductase [Alphaproteobacteria bacterium]|nr:CmcJ/NvfI family oxidoreductase [Alphaproteobacteria bacterium]